MAILPDNHDITPQSPHDRTIVIPRLTLPTMVGRNSAFRNLDQEQLEELRGIEAPLQQTIPTYRWFVEADRAIGMLQGGRAAGALPYDTVSIPINSHGCVDTPSMKHSVYRHDKSVMLELKILNDPTELKLTHCECTAPAWASGLFISKTDR